MGRSPSVTRGPFFAYFAFIPSRSLPFFRLFPLFPRCVPTLSSLSSLSSLSFPTPPPAPPPRGEGCLRRRECWFAGDCLRPHPSPRGGGAGGGVLPSLRR